MNRPLYRKTARALEEFLRREVRLDREARPSVFAAAVIRSAAERTACPHPERLMEPELIRACRLLSPAQAAEANRILESIPLEDWRIRPELAGWLYQYMLEDRKAELFQSFKKGSKAGADDIPAITQLFTPDWIARYMAENTVGRIAVENGMLQSPSDRWLYYDHVPEVRLMGIRSSFRELHVLDPACGCGHVLAAVFDVLADIAEAEGVEPEAALHSMLADQLSGLDIDPVAVSLCRLVLMLKAAARFPGLAWAMPPASIRVWNAEDRVRGSLLRKGDAQGLPEPHDPARELLSRTYDAVLTNPPYLGRRHMGPELAAFLDKHYPRSSGDLYAAFLERMTELVRPDGYTASIHQHSWMFLQGYEQLREHMLRETEFVTLLHLGARAFQDIGGEVVQTVSLVQRKSSPHPDTSGVYWKLTEENTPQSKESAFLKRSSRPVLSVRQQVFSTLPGQRIAYGLPAAWAEAFHGLPALRKYFAVKKGMDTGDNARFVRYWHEVPHVQAGGDGKDGSPPPWRPYAKGGGSRRWYGNHYFVVDWSDDGLAIRQHPGSNLRNRDFYGKPGLTWSTVTTGKPSFRLLEAGFLFDNGGSCLFPAEGTEADLFAVMAYLNSTGVMELLRQLNPTLNIQPGDVGRLPVSQDLLRHPELGRLGRRCTELAREAWDETEASWSFREHPLVRHLGRFGHMEGAYEAWSSGQMDRSTEMERLEKEIDRLVNEHLGLQPTDHQHGTPDPAAGPRPHPNRRNAAAALISYVVGCLTGRYGAPPNTAEPVVPLLVCTETDLLAGLSRLIGEWGGPECQGDNLIWLAEALGTKRGELPARRLLRYFREEWYDDHLSSYQGRPAYARLSSGRSDAFLAYAPLLRLDRSLLEAVSRKVQEQQLQHQDTAGTEELEAFRLKLSRLQHSGSEPPPCACARARWAWYAEQGPEATDGRLNTMRNPHTNLKEELI